jgi:hypothetical protein
MDAVRMKTEWQNVGVGGASAAFTNRPGDTGKIGNGLPDPVANLYRGIASQAI